MSALRLAHRGAWGDVQENSLSALQAAGAARDCHGIEFDVRAARDGTPVVIHDDGLWRVQRVDADVSQLDVATLADHGVPTLAQALLAVDRDPFLDIELKEWVPQAVEVIANARAQPGDSSRIERTVISSFLDDALRFVHRLQPNWPLWLNSEETSPAVYRRAVALGCTGVSAEWHAVDGDAARRAAAAGLELAAWTVTRQATFKRLERLGVVAICVEGAALSS